MTLKEKFIKKWISSDSHLEWNDDYTELKNEAKIDLDELLRETAEKAYSEMPGWRFKNFDEYWKSVTSPNTGDKK